MSKDAEIAVPADPVPEPPSAKATPEVSAPETPAPDAETLISQGKRLNALRQYSDACEKFSDALELLNKEHGEMSPQTVDVLIAYGNALLNSAITSSGVLGNNQSEAAKPVAAPAQAESSTSSNPAQNLAFHFDTAAELDEEEEDEEEEEKETKEDEDGDLTTAFLILDMARVILAKSEDRTDKLKLASVYESLADVATEDERFEEAYHEQAKAYAIHKALLEPYNRLICSNHLNMALALEHIPNNSYTVQPDALPAAIAATPAVPVPVSTLDQALAIGKGKEKSTEDEPASGEQRNATADAILHIQLAKDGLNLRKSLLQEETEENKEMRTAFMASLKELDRSSEAEIKDIDELVADLDEKLEELKSIKSLADDAAERKRILDSSFAAGSSLPEGVSKTVNNLNNLVKKKSKPAPAANGGLPEVVEKNGVNPTEPVVMQAATVEKSGSLKRKAESDDEAEETTVTVTEPTEPVSKRAKVEDEPSDNAA